LTLVLTCSRGPTPDLARLVSIAWSRPVRNAVARASWALLDPDEMFNFSDHPEDLRGIRVDFPSTKLAEAQGSKGLFLALHPVDAAFDLDDPQLFSHPWAPVGNSALPEEASLPSPSHDRPSLGR